jgi:TPR repeat protein
MYHNGQGVPQDDAEALKWLSLAADQSNADAQCNLGLMYADGWGVPKDIVRALMWFNLSAAQGNQEAATKRKDVAPLTTRAQIAEAQKLAREWKPTKQPPR